MPNLTAVRRGTEADINIVDCGGLNVIKIANIVSIYVSVCMNL